MNSQNLSFIFKFVLNLDRLLIKYSKNSKGHISLTTLTRWSNQFKRGLNDLKDKHRKVRPITETIMLILKDFGLLFKTIPYELMMKLKLRQPSLVMVLL
jgi:hypothetical protein